MRTFPFFGKGVAFPFRVNSATGGVQITAGGDDHISVAMRYLQDRWTIRENVDEQVNHIAESISHILLTRQTEHDTLPEFGSDLHYLIFEPNNELFQQEAEHFFVYSTIRWEKRAMIPEAGGVSWYFEGQLVDQGHLGLNLNIEFIVQQVAGNLVSPFVTPREARLQEYASSNMDGSKHDVMSRYYRAATLQRDGIAYNRFRRPSPMLPRSDDRFYKVRHKDTWMLISWRNYGDIRYWPALAEIWIYDQAQDRAGRSHMDPCLVPEPGTILRVPSTARMLL